MATRVAIVGWLTCLWLVACHLYVILSIHEPEWVLYNVLGSSVLSAVFMLTHVGCCRCSRDAMRKTQTCR